MLAPSKANLSGCVPTVKLVVRFALYQCRRAIWSGFLLTGVTPSSGTDRVSVNPWPKIAKLEEARRPANTMGRILVELALCFLSLIAFSFL